MYSSFSENIAGLLPDYCIYIPSFPNLPTIYKKYIAGFPANQQKYISNISCLRFTYTGNLTVTVFHFLQ